MIGTRFCTCGKRKVECRCWATGAGDESAMQREGYSTDQLALVDYVRAVLHHGLPPIDALVNAMRIEMAGDGLGALARLRVAWRLIRPS